MSLSNSHIHVSFPEMGYVHLGAELTRAAARPP